MNRYGEFYGYDGISLKSDGEFVLYEDASQKILKLEKERDQLKAKIESLMEHILHLERSI